jgi:hypothetical protein
MSALKRKKIPSVLGSEPLQERRRLPRYQAPASSTAVGIFPGGRQHSLRILNISLDGLCFTTSFDITRESLFTLCFSLSIDGRPAMQFETPAKIMWFTFDRQAALYTAGVKFLGLRGERKEALEQALSCLTPW